MDQRQASLSIERWTNMELTQILLAQLEREVTAARKTIERVLQPNRRVMK